VFGGGPKNALNCPTKLLIQEKERKKELFSKMELLFLSSN
jgi:hypothetical protein